MALCHNKGMNKCPCEPKEPKCTKVDGITIVVIPESLGDDSQGSTYAPEIGAYTNTVVKYLANGYVYIYDKKGNYTMVADSDVVDIAVDKKLDIKSTNAVENRVITAAINELTTGLKDEIQARKDADDEIISDLSELDKSLAKVAKTGEYSDLLNKPVVDTALSTTSKNAVENRAIATALDAEKNARIAADNGLRDDINAATTAINKDVVTDVDLDPTISTTDVKVNSTKTNLKTGSTATESFTLPVASSTQAGVINSATYDSIREAIQIEQAVVHGSVAVSGMPASPSQEDITNAWKTATGQTTLINRAEVYDVSHNKVWTYYENDTTWHATSNTTQVTVQQFTNTSLGTIKGSTVDGQIYAETNGTGSVNGWDTMTTDVTNAKSKLATIEQGAEANVQSDWDETDTTADDYIKNKPTLSTVATSGDYDDLTNKPIDSNTNVGSGVNPVYVKDGEVKASVSNVGNSRKPVYLKDGSITATDATVGAADTPIYMSNGTLMAGGKLSKVATSGDFNDLINKPTEVDVDTTRLRKLAPYDTDTALQTGDDLNNFLFRQIGTYYCKYASTAQAILNCPTSTSFKLEVAVPGDILHNDEIETKSHAYLLQTVTDIDGKVFTRTVTNDSGTPGNFTYGDWKKVATIDPADDLDLSKLAYVSDEVPSGYVPVFGTQSIEDLAITTAKLDNGAVTADKLAWASIEDVITNNNGVAIKYHNGTMVCYKVYQPGEVVTGATYGDTQWNFPANFITTPCAFVMATRGNGDDYNCYVPRMHNIGVNFAQFIWNRMTADGTQSATNKALHVVSYYAIGRWK